MPKKGRKVAKACAYCGAVTASWTADHVVPRGLFTPPYQYLVKVPACRECNVAKSQDDDFLRGMLVLDDAVKDHPVASAIRDGPFFRSVARGKSLVARIAVTQGEMARDGRTGLYLPHLVAVPFTADRTARVFRWLVHGLYYAQTGLRLDARYRIGVLRLSEARLEETLEALIALGIDHAWYVGHGEFRYMFGRFPNDHNATLWVMCFYNRIFFHVVSLPADLATTAALLADFMGREAVSEDSLPEQR